MSAHEHAGIAGPKPEPVVEPDAAETDALLGRLEVIEAQPLTERAAGFQQLAAELLAELQRSDAEPAGARAPK